ncbi:MAG: type II toxin-antitoxin system ParD family antitoxin [Reyranella sp.]|uniref:ribbon-helix-helix domain-containing protein n=1 Tax=Reyranella sp. TaxID=1929291 RepID=UPI003D114BEA
MTITLPREQQEWLEAQVAAGHYDSVEQAVASIVAEHMLLEIDDLAWAKPLVDEARESPAGGEGLSLEEYRARMTERFGEPER